MRHHAASCLPSCLPSLQMKLPEPVTCSLTRLLFQPDALLFSEALFFVLKYLAQHRWPAFRQDVAALHRCGHNGHPPFTDSLSFRGADGPSQQQQLQHHHQAVSSEPSPAADPPLPSSRGPSGATFAPRKSSLILRKDGKKYTDGVR
jgi:hypothetical protein